MVPAIFNYEIKRSKQQELFRYKNDLKGNYQLWHQEVAIWSGFKGFIATFVRSGIQFVTNIWYALLRLIIIIRFNFKKPKKVLKVNSPIKQQGRSNNFDFLRFIFALLVVISHSYPLSGNSENAQWIYRLTDGQMNYASLGLNGFFIISGFFFYKVLRVVDLLGNL